MLVKHHRSMNDEENEQPTAITWHLCGRRHSHQFQMSPRGNFDGEPDPRGSADIFRPEAHDLIP